MNRGSNSKGPSMCNGTDFSGQGVTRLIITGERLGGDTHWWYLA